MLVGQLNRKDYKDIFLALENESLLQVARKYKLDESYEKKNTQQQYIYRIYRKVANDPITYKVTHDQVNKVVGAIKGRSYDDREDNYFGGVPKEDVVDDGLMTGVPDGDIGTPEKQYVAIDKNEIVDLLKSGRDKTIKLMHRKLDDLIRSRRALDKESLTNLSRVFGILFDKSQVVQGEATQHIAILAKNVDDNLTPEEQMEMLNKFREKTSLSKHSD